MVGLYLLRSCGVARRREEAGIRLALGAQRSSVIRLVITDVVVTLAIGTAVRIVISLLAGKLSQNCFVDCNRAIR